MATGQVKKMFALKPVPVLIMGIDGRVQWNEVFENNPKIARKARPQMQRLLNGPHARPYIQAKNKTKWMWRPYKPEPGEIFLTDAERAFAEPFAGRIMIEPNVKDVGHTNKAWPFERWQSVADAGIAPMIQCGSGPFLRGVEYVETPTFRHACAILAVSRGFVGCEGGLMHAAAALNVPGAILYGEFISTDITGYALHRNIRHAGNACGSRVPCEGCRASMLAISVEEVLVNIKEITMAAVGATTTQDAPGLTPVQPAQAPATQQPAKPAQQPAQPQQPAKPAKK